MSRKYLSNSTQLPNAVVDELMPHMSGNELKCYLFIVRKTMGWHKQRDSISVSQFCKGTGIKDQRSVKRHLKTLVDMNLIETVLRAGKPTSYSLNLQANLPGISGDSETQGVGENVGGAKNTPPTKKPTTGGTKKPTGTPYKNTPPQNQLQNQLIKPKRGDLSELYPNLNVFAWEKWTEYRRLRKIAKYKTDDQIKHMSKFSYETQLAAVEDSIRNGYQGVWPEKHQKRIGGGSNLHDANEQAIHQALANAGD